MLKLLIRRFLKSAVGDDEIGRKTVFSPQLKKWIQSFSPDIIYVHYSSLGSLHFAEQITSYCGVPYVLHFMDDFYHFKYTKGLLAPYFNRKWISDSNKYISKAACCLAISTQMASAYQKIFDKKFDDYLNTVEIDKWDKIPARVTKNSTRKIIYSGTINNKNIKTLLRSAKIVDDLKKNGESIHFEIYSFQPRLDAYKPQFEQYLSVSMIDSPEGDGIIPVLKSADILLLPIDFTQDGIETMKYSMFTKIPAYMASGVPILYWGPSSIAATEYAKRGAWAFVVDVEEDDVISKAIMSLLKNNELRVSFIENARKMLVENHESSMIRNRFQMQLDAISG